jgi:hypothetical protein
MTVLTSRIAALAALAAVVSVATALGACGSDARPERGATSANPVTRASTNEGQGRTQDKQAPGYQALVERQTGKPRSTFTPCNLVTARQAAAIVGPIGQQVEAPQGPSCIYRSRDGNRFITIAVQTLDFPQIKQQIHRPTRVAVSSRTAYCGSYGQPMLFLPLSQGRVLSITGPCGVAKQFAAKALPQLLG